MQRFPIKLIISGGQTGVDRAALDFAIAAEIPCAGWCPAGRRAEDGCIPEKYPLKETSGRQYPQRTRKNVKDSDATLILYFKELSGGTLLTRENAEKYFKPWFCYDLGTMEPIDALIAWLFAKNPAILNIAGPRESENLGIHGLGIQVLEKVLMPFKGYKIKCWPPKKPKTMKLKF
jgi:hypothetical protein